MIDVKNLSKEAKQKLILAGIVGLFLLYVAINMGLSPLVERVKELRTQEAELEQKLSGARRIVKNERNYQSEIKSLGEKLNQITLTELPPQDGPLSWVSGRLNTAARQAGVTLDRVQGANNTSGGKGSAFRGYGVQVTLKASYFDLMHFLQAVERANPLCGGWRADHSCQW